MPPRILSAMRRAGFVVLLHATLACPRAAAQAPVVPASRVFAEGEELTYNVRYGFINLGQVRVRFLGDTANNGIPVHRARGLIDSYRGIPFVDLHAVYETMLDTAAFSRKFVGKSKEDDYWDFYRYDFQYDRNRVLIEFGQRDTSVAKRETLDVRTPYNDGLSLFWLARERLFSGMKIDVPTLIKDQKAVTHIDFTGEHTQVEIDAVEYPVDVVGFKGSADFVGLYGLTGDFEGWFSNDEARVPILAKMKVIIGKVTIELMGWKRTGWQPPRAKD